MFKKTKLLWFSILLVFIAGVILYLTAQIKISSYKKYIITEIDSVPTSSVALIFGAGVRPNGTLSDALEDRVLTGIDLYKEEKVKKLLMSGDNGRKTYDEVTAMKKFAVEKGVPEEDIVLDYAGFDTYDTCYRAREIFDLKKDVVLISQSFHLPRALYVCRRLGVESIGLTADRRVYATNLWGYRESLARIKAVLDVEIFRSKPKFLGQKEKIF